jgi:hypothetical protein
MSPGRPFDASIPVLTDVFHADEAPAATPVHGARAPAATTHSPSATTHSPSALRDAELEPLTRARLSEAEWSALERRLTERILQQLQGRVDFVLEQRLRDSMEQALKSAITGLTAEIRHGLQHTIEDIVARAVSGELTHLKTLKK